MTYHRPASAMVSETVEGARATSRQVFIRPEESPNFALRKFRIEAGGEIPLHSNSVEHEQFVLSGEARVRVGAKEFTARAGDAILIPAGVEHSYVPLGERAYEFICVVLNAEDILTLVE